MLALRWLVFLGGGVLALLYSYFSGDQTVSVEIFRIVWVLVAWVAYLSFYSFQNSIKLPMRMAFVLVEVALVALLAGFTGGYHSPFLYLFWFLVTLAALDHGSQLGLMSGVLACLACGGLAHLGGDYTPDDLAGRWFSLIALSCLGFVVSRARVREAYERFDQSEEELARFHHIARKQHEVRQEAEERLFEERRRFEGLVETANQLASLRHRDLLLGHIVDCALNHMSVQTAAILLVKDDNLLVADARGLSFPGRERLEGPLNSFPGRILISGEAVAFDRQQGSTHLEQFAPYGRFQSTVEGSTGQTGFTNKDERFQNFLMVPLVSAHEQAPFGLLFVANLATKDIFSHNDVDYLRILATNAAIALRNLEAKARIEQTHFEMIQALAQAIEAKDLYTSNHVGRVRDLSVRIAEVIGLEAEQVRHIGIAATLHDIGKISTPDAILSKPGGLTSEEYTVMKQHAANGAAILKKIRSLPKEVHDMVLHHHERWDGKGYPSGLRGDQIPLGSQIIAVADCYDAMTFDRPYRKGFGRDEALRKMEEGCGTQFNSRVLCAFFAMCGYHPRTNHEARAIFARSYPELQLDRPPVFRFATMAHVPEIETPRFAVRQVNTASTKEKQRVLQIETKKPKVLHIETNKESRA